MTPPSPKKRKNHRHRYNMCPHRGEPGDTVKKRRFRGNEIKALTAELAQIKALRENVEKENWERMVENKRLKEENKAVQRVIEAAKKLLDVSNNGHPTYCDLWPTPQKSDKCTCGADVILKAENELEEALDKIGSYKKGD